MKVPTSLITLYWLLSISATTIIIGCDRIDALNRREIQLPHSSLFTDCEQWAVVTADYTTVHDQPELSAPVLQVIRNFDLAEVTDRSDHRADRYSQYAYWYQIVTSLHSGWVFGGDVSLYCYRHVALLAISSAQDRNLNR